MSRRTDPARAAAFTALRAVHADDAYGNLALADAVERFRLSGRDAAFATELFSGAARLSGTYRSIIEKAAGRPVRKLDAPLVDALILGAHQLLSMRVPSHAAVSTSVDLATEGAGRRVTGIANAVLRRISERDLGGWLDVLTKGAKGAAALAIRTHHPRWITEAYVDLLGPAEAALALDANNVPPTTSLVVRPGLATVDELLDAGATPGAWSPFAASLAGNPADVPAVRQGRAGVQDEGSQLVALALSRVEVPHGPWLDLCAGPGGKAALLAGLAVDQDTALLAGELQPHRARLVRQALRAYGRRDAADPRTNPLVITADGREPAWQPGAFSRVMADVPCTGLGALRRRPESRWRRLPEDLTALGPLQRDLLATAIESTAPGGVLAYVTCSPHRDETTRVVEDVLATRTDVEVVDAAPYLPEVPDAALGPYVQLWGHRHGTDAMFCALVRRR